MSNPANNQPVPRPPSSVKRCNSCGTAVYKPKPHCKSGCGWWRCVSKDCERTLNDSLGHAIRRVY